MKIVHSAAAKSDNNSHEVGPVAAQDGTSGGTGPARRGRRSEAQRTADLLTSLPEGVQIGRWGDGRGKPFYVRWGKERKVESFASELDRNDAAERLAGAREEEGSAVLSFDPQEWRAWQAFRAACPAPLADLQALWREHGQQATMTVADAIPRYLELRETEDVKVGSGTHGHMKIHLQRLGLAYGALRLDQVTADLIRDLLGKLTGRDRVSPASNDTKRDHRKHWNSFFQRAVDEEWCAKNPVAKVKPPKVFALEKVPLKPREIFDLLKANRNEPVVGRIALELFGGLRAASAERLKKEHLRFEAQGIRMPGAVLDKETGQMVNNHKSSTTKYRQGHPPILWEWLRHAPEKCWTEINADNYGAKKAHAFIRAHVTNPGNVLRDSFASYHLALFKNPPQTAYFMQHTHMKQTETYEGIAEEADAKLVMAMTPKNVTLAWARFVAKAAQ